MYSIEEPTMREAHKATGRLLQAFAES